MKRLRFLAALLLAVCTMCVWPVSPARAAASAFSFQLEKRSAAAGDTVALDVKIGANTGIAGFRLRVSYDASFLRFAGASVPQQIEQGTMQTNAGSNPVCSVYVCNVDRGYASPLSGTVVTYLFQVLQDAPAGATDVCTCVDETCDYSAADLCLDTFNTLSLHVVPPVSGEASLPALRPSVGELEPAFSPDVTSYRLNVDSSVSYVMFQADAVPGVNVRINRRSLFTAGSETPITVTVTSADKKAKAVYLITVCRAAKEPESVSSGGKDPSSKRTDEKTDLVSKKLRERTASSGKDRRDSFSSAAERALAAARTGRKAKAQAESTSVVLPTLSTRQTPTQAAMRPVSAQTAVPLTVVQSQMPSYLVGMLAAGFCIVTGILLSIWFGFKKK